MGYENVTWNFLEASHGKGPAAGVGGAIKRQADSFVAEGRDISRRYRAVRCVNITNQRQTVQSIDAMDAMGRLHASLRYLIAKLTKSLAAS